MRHVTENVKSNSSTVDRLDDVRMSERDRALAKAHMRDAEFVADLIFRAVADIQSVVALVERGVVGLARRVKSMFVRPAQR